MDAEDMSPAGATTETGATPAPSAPSTLAQKTRKQKLATEPHGYLADKLVTFLRAMKQLLTGGRPSESGEKGAREQPAAAHPESADTRGAAAIPITTAGELHPPGLLHQVHHHETADQLHNPLSTTAKLRNAVVSTVEHALDEAAAVQASLGQATTEELSKFRLEAHRGPTAPTTTGGLPLTEE